MCCDLGQDPLPSLCFSLSRSYEMQEGNLQWTGITSRKSSNTADHFMLKKSGYALVPCGPLRLIADLTLNVPLLSWITVNYHIIKTLTSFEDLYVCSSKQWFGPSIITNYHLIITLNLYNKDKFGILLTWNSLICTQICVYLG